VGAELLGHTTYGGWSAQRPAHGTIGRFSQEMTTLQPDGRTFRLGFKFDRALYQLFRAAMVDHYQAMDDSLLCPSWSGAYNTPARGVWEFDLKAPATDRVELVAMLWPQDDKVWPKGEINILEGRVGSGRTMTNLHWADPSTNQPEHDPLMVDVDVAEWHRYRLEIDNHRAVWSVDGTVVRELESPHVPHDVPTHLVVQAGVNPAIMGDWHENFWWEQEILFRPVSAPGIAEEPRHVGIAEKGKMSMFTREFWVGAAERALKTVAQSVVAVLGVGAVGILAVDWVQTLSVAAAAGLASILTSIADADRVASK
jgi:gp32